MERLTTKEVIAETFKELLLNKPLDKISIQDIVEASKISRKTFYYHFLDIPDLIEWICIEEADKEINKNKEYKSWEEAFLAVFNLIIKDKQFVLNIYHSVSHDALTRYLYKLVYPVIYKVVNLKSEKYLVNDSDKAFITNFYMFAFVSLVLDFVDKGMKEDPKKIIDKLSPLLEGTIEHAVKTYANKKL